MLQQQQLIISFVLQIGLSIAVVLMFGNEMLFSSWLFCCLVASIVVFLVMEPITLAIFSTNVKDTQRRPSVVFSAVKLVLVTVLTVLAKQGAGVVLNIQDDVSYCTRGKMHLILSNTLCSLW